jgi:hypothetical protein
VRNAYIVEHVAYITQILFYATFILYHTPNPEKPVHVVWPYDSEEQPPQTQGDDTVPLVQLVHISTLNRL